MGRVVHFEFPVDDPERAVKFFKDAFGWNIEKWGEGGQDYWLVMTGDREQMGIDGGFSRRGMGMPGMVNIIQVEDIDQAVTAVEQAGGKITHPKMEIPKVGTVAYFTDTEGTNWGMIQFAEGAMHDS
jgi:hypothetical protein